MREAVCCSSQFFFFRSDHAQGHAAWCRLLANLVLHARAGACGFAWLRGWGLSFLHARSVFAARPAHQPEIFTFQGCRV